MVTISRATQPTSQTVNSAPNSFELAANVTSYPAVNWQTKNHTHGLSLNPTNPNVIYLATHHGLIQRTETGKWLWMQPKQQRADYMGFTSDLTNPTVFMPIECLPLPLLDCIKVQIEVRLGV